MAQLNRVLSGDSPLGSMAQLKRVMSGHSGPTAVSCDTRAVLNYQQVIPGKRVGRYIGVEDAGELADVHEQKEVHIGSARDLLPAATLDTRCFELRWNPTNVADFFNSEEVKQTYYPEIEGLVMKATGAERVIVFDHTVRDTGAGSQLNVSEGAAAAAVQRVHTDYSDGSGPRRIKTLAESGGYTGLQLSDEEKEDILSREFCIVNVWRNIKDEPVQRKPLACLDPMGLVRDDFVTYEMQYPERVGENYALKYSDAHQWYYYPQMVKDECLLFKTWESRTDRPRYCFHTAFEGVDTPADAPERASIEVRTVAIMPRKQKPVFYDMLHSNNAARIRLYIQLAELEDVIDSHMIVYADLQDPEYAKKFITKKVPAFIAENGTALIESKVILDYVADKYGPKDDGGRELFTLGTPEGRALNELFIRLHDIYISSPNCTEPGFAHTQGCMYLAPYETPFCPAARAMDRPTRAAKLAEIWKQLNEIERMIQGPYMCGPALTFADLTWFPTVVFMEFMLPRVFSWPDIADPECTPFPKLAVWYSEMKQIPCVAKCHSDIWAFWVGKWEAGQFTSIIPETEDTSFKWKYP